MDDGCSLDISIYSATPTKKAPTPSILIRTSNGRHRLRMVCRILARAGFRVICQDIRPEGLPGSERSDGAATVRWIHEHYPGSTLGILAMSSLGESAWATVAGVKELEGSTASISCLVSIACSSDLSRISFARMYDATPPIDTVSRLLSAGFPTPRSGSARSHRKALSQAPSAHFISGWSDFCLEALLVDYRLACLRDPKTRLTIGPWNHLQALLPGIHLALDHFRRQLLPPGPDDPGQPVNVFLQESHPQGYAGTWTGQHTPGRWVSFDHWPPREVTCGRWWFSRDQRLLGRREALCIPRIDQASAPEPTEKAHFTSEVFSAGITLAGHVGALVAGSTTGLETTHVVRLWEVFPDGYAELLVQGRGRLRQEEDSVQVAVGSLFHSVAPGNRLRVSIGPGRSESGVTHSIQCAPETLFGSYIVLPVWV